MPGQTPAKSTKVAKKKAAAKAAKPRKAAAKPSVRMPAKRAPKTTTVRQAPTEATAPTRKARAVAAKPRLLAGGNPQIAKAEGDAPVQAYIAALPGWKRDVGRRLDALIAGAVPGVRKAVKWNSPFYAVEDRGWFLSFHGFARYIKVAFFRGTSLRPVPAGESKQAEVRYLDIHENELDAKLEARFTKWVKQASRLPGERM